MVKFISEISSNHSKDISRAFDFIDVSAEIDCDVVKFQLFKIDQLFSPEILSKSEKHRNRRQWELPVDFLPKLAERCQQKKIQFSCTPFYLEAVDELFPYVSFYKIASYELLWDDLLIKCAKTGKPVTLSTGMATIPEITRAVNILREHGCEPDVLHCTSAYPTPYNEANLGAIETIRKATNVKEVGWSDHTVSAGVIQRAIHRWGASTVEFHLDLDGKGEEFNTGHCWLPPQIGEVIKQVRQGLGADGTGIKEPVASELPDRLWRADPSDGLRPFKQLRESFLI